MDGSGYFPILAEIARTGERVVYYSSREIPSGVGIKVLKTNYEPPKEEEEKAS